jgi:hypothetical protein
MENNWVFEIFEFLFISSNIYLIYILGDLFIKLRLRFKFKREDIQFKLNKQKIILLWFSLSLIITYLF